MKKALLSILVFFAFAVAASAQTEKGSWMVGGNVTLNTAKDQTEISLIPSAGYFFFKNFVAGANVNISYVKQVDNKLTTLGVGPFARYYIGTMNVRPFADAEVSYESTKYKTSSSSSTVNSTNFFLGGGVAAFINRNVAIEGLAGYKHSSFMGGPGTGGFNLRIGFQVYLSGEQVDKMRR